jgi:hypothetical protein
MNFLVDSAYMVFFLLLGIGYAILWLWALVDLLRSEFKDSNMKLIWAVVLIFANPIGPFVYFILSREQKSNTRKYINK